MIHRNRFKLFGLLVALVALCAMPLVGRAVAAPVGTAEIHEFAVEPDASILTSPDLEPTQAGGHPNVHIWMRYCNPLPHIAGVTNANPAVFTTDVTHGLNVGDFVTIRGIEGNLTANVRLGQIGTVPTPKSFTVNVGNPPAPLNTTTSGVYTKGGWVSLANTGAHGCTPEQKSAQLRRFLLKLPPGFLGNPQALPTCPVDLWVAGACPDNTVLGQSNTRTVQLAGASNAAPIPVPTRLYNVAAIGLEPARLGTDILVGDPPGPIGIAVTLRTAQGGDDGINSAVIDLPKNLGGPQAAIMEIDTTLCGAVPCHATVPDEPQTVVPNDPATAKPFFLNPTSCKPAKSTLEGQSWTVGTATVSSDDIDPKAGLVNPNESYNPPLKRDTFTPTHCEKVPFDARVTVTQTETNAAGAPSAQDVAVDYGRDFSLDRIWQSALRDVELRLPEGMTLSPGGGVGLEACSYEQFGISSTKTPDPNTGRYQQLNNDPSTCPAGSQIGTLDVDTPVLPSGSLSGKVFFGPVTGPGRPTPASPWKLFLLIEGAGLRIKLAGDVDVAEDGTVHNIFTSQPEVPFNKLTLHLRGGDRAILANPETCDNPHTGAEKLTGWSGKVNDSNADPTFAPKVTTTCPDSQPAFAPSVDSAGSDPEDAGANTTSSIVLSRTDGQDDIKQIKLSLPPGAVGSLAAVPECPIANAQAGTCGEGSKIGTVKTTVGTGTSLLTVAGSLYLAEPSESGDAATLALVVPAKAGPIDLGQVVVLNHVKLRDSDTGVDAITTDIPRILGGVKLHVRRIEIKVDRPGFFLNPTGCEPRPLNVTFTGYSGATATSTQMLNAKNCDALPFAPKLRMISGAAGQNRQLAHPPLTAIVTQGPGEANIRQAKVVLPDLLRPNTPQFNIPGGLCSDAQFAQGACPGPSRVGDARVITPVLPFQLAGPVYVVQETGSILPKLYVVLRGEGIQVVLHARNAFQGIRTVNTFENLPDVPQSYFELNIKGGKGGILNNFYNACSTTKQHLSIDSTFTGQNGKTVTAHPQLERAGCVSASSLGASISSRTIKVSRKGVAKVKVRCGTSKRCKGRLTIKGKGVGASKKFSIKAKRTGSVKLKFSKKEVGKIRHHKGRRMKSRAAATVGGRAARKNVVLVAAKR